MQVRYVGMFEEVIVPEVSTTETVKRGASIEVDDGLASRLLAQAGNWEAVPAAKSSKER
jgi:hypothetical protein